MGVINRLGESIESFSTIVLPQSVLMFVVFKIIIRSRDGLSKLPNIFFRRLFWIIFIYFNFVKRHFALQLFQ